MLENKTFYPTPKNLITKMVSKIKGSPTKILEPSAGKGDIIDYLCDEYDYHGHYRKHQRADISAIEIDEDLQATLRGKYIKVIDNDFLTYGGPDKYDLIIANPPFDDGDKHLLKAIDIMYRGEIVFLLNAETIKNPYTNIRKDLAKKLTALNADIEYLTLAFKNAERPTDVEAALVYINIERKVEDDLFAGCDNTAEEVKQPGIEATHEVSTGKTIEELVAEYNQIVKLGTDTIIGYFRNYKKIGTYIGLNQPADKDYSDMDMTGKMQSHINDLVQGARERFWRKTLDLSEVRSRLTSKKQDEFESQIKDRCHMDFTEHNIRQFVLNLMAGHEKTLIESVMDIFDKFTIRHSFSNGLYDDNIHYYNGWKTNKAFKVNKKVILPIYAGYSDGPFIGFSKRWELHYEAARILDDIDIVMCYFDGMSNNYRISEALTHAFQRGETTKIESTYFTATVYKKGTIHLTFNSEDILRRFNVAACLGKNWLPHDYGKKSYQDMDTEEQATVDSFEGAVEYTKNLNQPLFAESSKLLKIAA